MKKSTKLSIVAFLSFVIVISIVLAICFYPMPTEKVLFVSKLTHVEPPTFGLPVYLFFANGRIITWRGDITVLVIGRCYTVCELDGEIRLRWVGE